MQPKSNNFLKFIPLIGGIIVISTGLLALNFYSKSENKSDSPVSLEKTISPLNLEQFCQKYQTVDRNLQPWNEESLSQQKVLVKTQTDADIPLSLDAVILPEINSEARKAKVPIAMYHDILPKKEVFFDVTPEELESHFELIKSKGVTPISLDQLIIHLRTGSPLPEKPILLSFDDGYGGHYEYVYPLLKKYNYPAIFSVYTKNMGINTGRSHVTWEQLKIMAADSLVTIAAHSKTHPPDLTKLSDEELVPEIVESKELLENNLGKSIRYFTYPTGKNDERVRKLVQEAGYIAALAMNDLDEMFAGESENLLTIGRFGQSRLQEMVDQASGGKAISCSEYLQPKSQPKSQPIPES
ncbi:MAG: polysaccharide deacetylase family protein [Richelia sp. RM2_1_2]|nr:polysaccharide deacetylase family protein [Richelia sp. SM1_7_0]NJN07677.1 polysaccharide deacetylase family protein [Richelia sp. RM1_1_1]NJO29503.1 polysaccharide deacetylase family protein [Richelia sp. SL_2_1]NJO61311.1 polysaccharide deacetylase family protein [Richelia sp. RM2_1_2]